MQRHHAHGGVARAAAQLGLHGPAPPCRLLLMARVPMPPQPAAGLPSCQAGAAGVGAVRRRRRAQLPQLRFLPAGPVVGDVARPGAAPAAGDGGARRRRRSACAHRAPSSVTIGRCGAWPTPRPAATGWTAGASWPRDRDDVLVITYPRCMRAVSTAGGAHVAAGRRRRQHLCSRNCIWPRW